MCGFHCRFFVYFYSICINSCSVMPGLMFLLLVSLWWPGLKRKTKKLKKCNHLHPFRKPRKRNQSFPRRRGIFHYMTDYNMRALPLGTPCQHTPGREMHYISDVVRRSWKPNWNTVSDSIRVFHMDRFTPGLSTDAIDPQLHGMFWNAKKIKKKDEKVFWGCV